MSAAELGQLTEEQRVELRRRAIERSRRRKTTESKPRGPRPPDGGQPMPAERAA